MDHLIAHNQNTKIRTQQYIQLITGAKEINSQTRVGSTTDTVLIFSVRLFVIDLFSKATRVYQVYLVILTYCFCFTYILLS